VSGAVNPIIVVKNNLPDYARELHDERIKLQDRLAQIDEQFVVLGKLAAVVGVEIGTTVERRAEIAGPMDISQARIE
jgi:hypothetical protein